MSKVVRQGLDPARRLVDETVAWLCGDDSRFAGHVITTCEGARSLAHVLVVVPTAESGRRLRLSLAAEAERRGWGGVLPPRIVQPNILLQPDDVCVATEAEERAVLADVLCGLDYDAYPNLFPHPPAERTPAWALDMARTLLGIATILGERALLFSEVTCEEDAARWNDLAKIETAFHAALSARGVVPRILARRHAALAGCVETDVTDIVLPAAVDVSPVFADYLDHSPQRVTLLLHAQPDELDLFDAWGRPTAEFTASLEPCMVVSAPTALAEADDIARYFRAVDARDALPALAVCDDAMLPELEGAFQNHFAAHELQLRNPAETPIAQSALGRILLEIVELVQSGDYETFSTFVRSGDVARWAAQELGVGAADVAAYVGVLDSVQNEHLPRTIDQVLSGAAQTAATARHDDQRAAAAGLVRLVQAIRAELVDPMAFLRKIFASLVLDETQASDRELIAAAGVVRDLRMACESELVGDELRRPLFVALLKEATYTLEPLAPNVLTANGWLEIPWCAEDELVLAGFNEGCVPENVVGHPFVPNALRERLGLMTNAMRARRDAYILAEALRCRAFNAVRISLHQIASDQNVMKPSRLLFPNIADADLPSLSLRLYAVTKGSASAPPKALPDGWRLKLPFPPKGEAFRESISVTALDSYVECPFKFYLNEIFGEYADDHAQELDSRTFGTLCHEALDRFAKNGVKDSDDSREIAAFLEEAVRDQLRAFGSTLPAVIVLQGEAAIERLRRFADLQALRRREGWRIIQSEQDYRCTIKSCPTVLRGKIDRLDEHEQTGELAIIDYKTWAVATDEKRDSLQLPIYRAMLEASGRFAPAKAHAARALYCVLAERAEDACFDDAHACQEGTQSEAEDVIVTALTNLAHGIFYPPSKNSKWADLYASLVWENPDVGIDPTWIADQTSRKEALS